MATSTDADSELIEHALLQGLISREQMQAIKRAPRGDRLRTMVAHGAITSEVARWLKERWEAGREQVIGPYKVVNQIGKGGMGAVYHARNEETGRDVALKVLAPHLADDRDFRERFLREARNAERVIHPNVVSCYGAGEHDGRLYMAQEYMAGGDLLRRLRSNPLPIVDALGYVVDCCRGLTSLGKYGLLHRDLKPANIYLDANGIAKLGDFGLVRNMDDNDKLTRSGVVVGTPAYMSPEQIKNEETLDVRTDVYSLGATLYHMVTGRRPFGGNSVYEVASEILNKEPADPRDFREDLPDEVAAVIFKSMAKKRTERYKDAATMLKDVLRVRDGEQPEAMSRRYVRKKVRQGSKRQYKSHLPKRGFSREIAIDGHDSLQYWLLVTGLLLIMIGFFIVIAWRTGKLGLLLG